MNSHCSLTIGVLTAAGAGAGSFSVLIGVVAQRVPAAKRSFASGFVNAGGSLGQFVFAPLNQLLIVSFGWMAAMWTMAVAALATIPIAGPLLTRRSPDDGEAARHCGPRAERAHACASNSRIASRDRSYWCLHAGFFTCGFHISFLVTHLPGEVKLCSLPASVAAGSLAIIGLANVAGSLMAGWAGGVMRMKWLLFAMYFSRAVAVAVYLAAPKTAVTFYLFAAVLGFTWLATVPPTAGLIGKLFGVRYLATLFGLATFTHQIGGFFGAWLGGKALTAFGDFSWMWYADIALALAAAFINLPIREAKLNGQPVSRNWGHARPERPSPQARIRPSIGRAAALSGNTCAVERGGRHAEVIAQHAFHDGAQVARRLEVTMRRAGSRAPDPASRPARGHRRPRHLTRTPRRPFHGPCRACH